MRRDPRGRVYYVDHNTRQTTWQRPNTDRLLNFANWQGERAQVHFSNKPSTCSMLISYLLKEQNKIIKDVLKFTMQIIYSMSVVPIREVKSNSAWVLLEPF